MIAPIAAAPLEPSAGWEPTLLRVGILPFEAGQVLPDAPCKAVVNALLLRGHGEVVLVDCGSGVVDHWWPGAAFLDEALTLAGAAADEVTCLVLTHLDFDHAGGALEGTWPDDVRPRFGRVVLLDDDLAWWRARTDDSLGAPLLAVLEPAGVVEPVADGAAFLPGLRLESAPGHRTGHAVVWIGDDLLHGADILHHALHIENPTWDFTFDQEREVALATRRAWIDRLDGASVDVVFSHVAEAGRIVAGHWQPLAP